MDGGAMFAALGVGAPPPPTLKNCTFVRGAGTPPMVPGGPIPMPPGAGGMPPPMLLEGGIPAGMPPGGAPMPLAPPPIPLGGGAPPPGKPIIPPGGGGMPVPGGPMWPMEGGVARRPARASRRTHGWHPSRGRHSIRCSGRLPILRRLTRRPLVLVIVVARHA